MDQEEFNQKLKNLEEQIKPIKQQIDSVEQALVDLHSLHIGLDEIREGKEILAPVGKGIFVRAKTLSENLTVDVGGKRYVKKSIPDTKDLLSQQLKKMQQVKEDLNLEMEKINNQLSETMNKYQNGQT